MASMGDRPAQLTVIDGLFDQGDEQALKDWADRGDRYASKRLVAILHRGGRPTEARKYIIDLTESGDEEYFKEYVELLEGDANVGRLMNLLTEESIRVDGRDMRTLSVAELLSVSDSLSRVIARSPQSKGDLGPLATQVKDLRQGLLWAVRNNSFVITAAPPRDLSSKGNAELRAMAELGDQLAAELLLDRLEQEDEDSYCALLNAWAEMEAFRAPERLAAYYSTHGLVEDLRRRAELGDHHAIGALDDLLYDQGDVGALLERAKGGDGLAESYYRYVSQHQFRDSSVGLSRRREDAPRLREVAVELHGEEVLPAFDYLSSKNDFDALDLLASERGLGNCAYSLGERADKVGLQKLVATADSGAVCELSRLHIASGDQDEALGLLAAQITRSDDYRAVDLLVEILVEETLESDEVSHCLDSIRTRADAGDIGCSLAIVKILSAWKDIEALKSELAAGNSGAGRAWPTC